VRLCERGKGIVPVAFRGGRSRSRKNSLVGDNQVRDVIFSHVQRPPRGDGMYVCGHDFFGRLVEYLLAASRRHIPMKLAEC
jgi:hypothetical protein